MSLFPSLVRENSVKFDTTLLLLSLEILKISLKSLSWEKWKVQKEVFEGDTTFIDLGKLFL